MTPLEIAAVLFTLANVWLAVKENMWTWPMGIVGVALYTAVNYQAKLYSNAGLQIVYLALNIHGWYEWMHGGVNRSELRITRVSRRVAAICLAAGVALTAGLMVLLHWATDAAVPFWDASTTAFSLVGQWMMNEKITENWIVWLAVDIAYVPIYGLHGYRLTAVLYLIFCWMAWKGWVEWKRSAAGAVAVGAP
jgi:nicotinamide mononucleotide transporter